MSSKSFSDLEIDAIGEILNISLGASATALSTMLNARVDITTPIVRVLTKRQFELEGLQPAIGVEITYVTGLDGSNVMLLKRQDVRMIVEMLMSTEIPDEEFELDEMNISAICEVMNQMMGASSTALSEFLGEAVNISTPVSFEIKDIDIFKEKYFDAEEERVCVNFTLRIGEKLESEFMNMMPVALAKRLVSGFFPDEGGEAIFEPEPVRQPEPVAAPEPEAAPSGAKMSQEEIEAMLANMGGDTPEPEPEPAPASSGAKMSQEEIEAMLANMGGGQEEVPAQSAAPVTPPPAPSAPVTPQAPMPDMSSSMGAQMPMGQPSMDESRQMMLQMQQMMASMQQMMMANMQQPKHTKEASKTINAQPLPTYQLNEEINLDEGQEENLEMIMGVPLEISVEIGRTRKLVKDILEFTKGTLVVLDKVAGEQVDLFVNGQCIAKGDVVVVEDNFGIRITEILAEEMPVLE